MPFPLQTSRFAAQLRRMFNIQGHVGLQAVDDVFPFFPVARSDDPELVSLRDEVRFSEGLQRTGLAANTSFIYISTAGSTGRLVVIDEVWVYTSPGATLEFFAAPYTVNGLDATGLVTSLDVRQHPAPASSGVAAGVRTFSGNEAALGIGSVFRGRVPADGVFKFEPGIVLFGREGESARFQVETVTLNVELDVVFKGRSRIITEQEKRPSG